MRTLPKPLFFLLALAVAAATAATVLAWRWATQPLPLAAPALEVAIPQGASPRTAAQRLAQGGVQVPAPVLHAYFRLMGQGQTIQPGDYAITRGMTAADVLGKLARGERIALSVRVIEGWTFRQMRQALARAPHLRQDTAGLDDAAVMQRLGRAGMAAEGRFFPDTYHYFKNASDLDVLRQALRLMDRRLAQAWQARAAGVPLQSADEALVLASIVEKETGREQDRALVAGVFANRLRAGMRLQTDPTVIYGLGAAFDGDLKRSHLLADTPYNTYTRAGLPPTPIALPGQAALMAAVQPASTPALYFVARGDGSSQFSQTLDEHNRAVQQYQRRKPAMPATP